MSTAKDFRAVALGMKGASESALAWRNIANSIEAARGKARQPRPVRSRPKR